MYWEDQPPFVADASPAFTTAGIFSGTSQLWEQKNIKSRKATDGLFRNIGRRGRRENKVLNTLKNANISTL